MVVLRRDRDVARWKEEAGERRKRFTTWIDHDSVVQLKLRGYAPVKLNGSSCRAQRERGKQHSRRGGKDEKQRDRSQRGCRVEASLDSVHYLFLSCKRSEPFVHGGLGSHWLRGGGPSIGNSAPGDLGVVLL